MSDKPFGTINGRRVPDDEFWAYVHKHAKKGKDGYPLMTVTRLPTPEEVPHQQPD